MGGAFAINAATLPDIGCRKWGWNYLKFIVLTADRVLALGMKCSSC
jgi:hypothetical protein